MWSAELVEEVEISWWKRTVTQRKIWKHAQIAKELGNLKSANPANTKMTRYIEAFSWTKSIDDFIAEHICERPLLNVCSGREPFGDVTMDKYEPADVQGDWINLPFANNSFAAVFADPPWNSGYKEQVSLFVNEALRVAPIAYLMAPWVYGSSRAWLAKCWVRHFPGVNTPILLTRYERRLVNQEQLDFSGGAK